MQEFTKILILEMHKVLTKNILKGATVWPLMVRGLRVMSLVGKCMLELSACKL